MRRLDDDRRKLADSHLDLVERAARDTWRITRSMPIDERRSAASEALCEVALDWTDADGEFADVALRRMIGAIYRERRENLHWLRIGWQSRRPDRYVDRLRGAASDAAMDEASGGDGPLDQMVCRESVAVIEARIALLDEGPRLLAEAMIEGINPNRAAKRLGVTEATAYNWARKIRSSLLAGLVDAA